MNSFDQAEYEYGNLLAAGDGCAVLPWVPRLAEGHYSEGADEAPF